MNFEEMLRLIDKVSDSSLSSFEYETEELKLSIQCGEKAVLTAAPMVSETELRENVSGKKEEPPEGKVVKSPLVPRTPQQLNKSHRKRNDRHVVWQT